MNRNHLEFIAWAALLALSVASCGGGGASDTPPPPPPGGSGNPPPPPVATAPENPILYLQFDNDVNSLQLVDAAKPGESVQVNPPVVAGGLIGPFALSPDLTQVAYLASQDTATEEDLYLADLAEPGTSTKLNGAMTPGGIVGELEFSPDGKQIAYLADQDVLDQFELYLVDLENPGVSTRLNPDLPAGGDVRGGISFSPDGSTVLYAADQDVEGVVDLYSVDVGAPGSATKVNAPFVDGGDIDGDDFGFSPDGATIVYIADQDVNGVNELYAVTVANPGLSTKLNPPLVADGDLCTFRFSPDSTKVGYCADQDVDGTLELYFVDLAVPGVSAKVNPPLPVDGDVQAGTFLFGPNSDFMVYRADQDVEGVQELYRVEVAAPGVSTKINPALVADGDVSLFLITPDGLQLVYAADQDTEGVAELYKAELSTPGTSAKLNPPRQGSEVWQIEITEDGSQVLYNADQDTAGMDELYRIDIASAGMATKINGTLPADSDVFLFAIAPGFPFVFEPPPPVVPASFSEIQDTIFTPSCATSGCHSGANPPDGLNLSAGQAYANIVNVASVQMASLFRIEPGDPDNSYLIRKVQGSGIVAGQMPLNAAPLSQEQIDLLRQWVSEGAQNN